MTGCQSPFAYKFEDKINCRRIGKSKQKKCDPTHFAPGHGEKMKDEWVGYLPFRALF